MLTEQQCRFIETALRENAEPRKVAAYLCLHMGLTLSEVMALQWQDIDLVSGTLTLRHALSARSELQAFDPPRALRMPPHVIRYLQHNERLYAGKERYVMTGESGLPAFHHMQNILTTVALKAKLGRTLSASDLRNAFIRRCIQSGMDLYSICAYIDIKQPNVIAKRFAEYFQPQYEHVDRLERFSADYKPPDTAPTENPKRMNLLILGAGSQGPVLKEIAETIGIFHEIAFLDDDPDNDLAIGPLSDLSKLIDRYPLALPSFGDATLRRHYMDLCEQCGYIVVGLTHPNATVSPAAVIDRSVVIEARSVISSGAVIGRGALVSSGSVIGPGAHIGQFAQIGASATIEKNAAVAPFTRIPSGTVVGEEQAG